MGRRPAMLDSLQRPILTLNPFPLVLAVTLDCVRKYERHQRAVPGPIPSAGDVEYRSSPSRWIRPSTLPVLLSNRLSRSHRPHSNLSHNSPGQGTLRRDQPKEWRDQAQHEEDICPHSRRLPSRSPRPPMIPCRGLTEAGTGRSIWRELTRKMKP